MIIQKPRISVPFDHYFNPTETHSTLILDICSMNWVSQVLLVIKNPLASAGDIRDMSSIPGSGRSPVEGHGNLFQFHE